MNRDTMLLRLETEPRDWDVIIIGGGATGLGCAIDSASRGYRTALVEAGDFARGTSSRSTKLVHGGVRYLRQGNLSLVLEALKERGRLRQNAPHLVSDLPFVVPSYDWWEAPFYGIGLRLYDVLAGKLGFGPSRNLSKKETLERLPTIETEGLRGGVIYHDGQFDDARLAIHMALTAASLGAILVNYTPVVALRKSAGVVRGVVARDVETERELSLDAKVVVNATGPFADSVLKLDDESAPRLIRPSQGIHIVLDRKFLPGDSAVLVPHTDDGRVLFAIPWHGRVIVGTTDTPIDDVSFEPRPLDDEIDFLLEHAARYLTQDPSRADVLSAFAGIRPLVGADDESATAAVSRDHMIHISRSGLVTVTGGKWTTYRKMAEDAIDQAAMLAALDERPSVTKNLCLHGHHREASHFGSLALYGADAPAVQELIRADASYAEMLHAALDVRVGEVFWAVREEMARTVEDFLSRRTRSLLLDAKASMEAAPRVAALMAEALHRSASWRDKQVEAYRQLAARYLPQ